MRLATRIGPESEDGPDSPTLQCAVSTGIRVGAAGVTPRSVFALPRAASLSTAGLVSSFPTTAPGPPACLQPQPEATGGSRPRWNPFRPPPLPPATPPPSPLPPLPPSH